MEGILLSDELLRAKHTGTLKVGDNELNCAVLEDGTRIISSSAVFRAFGRTKRGRKRMKLGCSKCLVLSMQITFNPLFMRI